MFHPATFANLQQDILLMQGHKPAMNNDLDKSGLSVIRDAFPNRNFPVAGLHEFLCDSTESIAASLSFISCMLSSLLKNRGTAIFISQYEYIFPPALSWLGLEAEKILFINLKNEKERIWVMEEALKLESVSAVIADIRDPGFTESRRFQLAMENSGSTGFIIRKKPKSMATASVARWKINHLPVRNHHLPGNGNPAWNVELLKIRNGKPGTWELEWKNESFRKILTPMKNIKTPERMII